MKRTGKKEKKNKGGRPTVYSVKLADEICELIAIGDSIRQICLLEQMPEERTIYRWLAKHEEFCQKYARAKELQADRFNEEIVEIADDGTNDWIEKENARTGRTYIALNEEAIARSRLRVETRKWLMGKHKPKKYGDSTTLKGDADNPLAIKQDITLTPADAYLKMLHG